MRSAILSKSALVEKLSSLREKKEAPPSPEQARIEKKFLSIGQRWELFVQKSKIFFYERIVGNIEKVVALRTQLADLYLKLGDAVDKLEKDANAQSLVSAVTTIQSAIGKNIVDVDMLKKAMEEGKLTEAARELAKKAINEIAQNVVAVESTIGDTVPSENQNQILESTRNTLDAVAIGEKEQNDLMNRADLPEQAPRRLSAITELDTKVSGKSNTVIESIESDPVVALQNPETKAFLRDLQSLANVDIEALRKQNPAQADAVMTTLYNKYAENADALWNSFLKLNAEGNEAAAAAVFEEWLSQFERYVDVSAKFQKYIDMYLVGKTENRSINAPLRKTFVRDMELTLKPFIEKITDVNLPKGSRSTIEIQDAYKKMDIVARRWIESIEKSGITKETVDARQWLIDNVYKKIERVMKDQFDLPYPKVLTGMLAQATGAVKEQQDKIKLEASLLVDVKKDAKPGESPFVVVTAQERPATPKAQAEYIESLRPIKATQMSDQELQSVIDSSAPEKDKQLARDLLKIRAMSVDQMSRERVNEKLSPDMQLMISLELRKKINPLTKADPFAAVKAAPASLKPRVEAPAKTGSQLEEIMGKALDRMQKNVKKEVAYQEEEPGDWD